MRDRIHLCLTPLESLFGRINDVVQRNEEIPTVITRRENRGARRAEKVATMVNSRRPVPLHLQDPRRLLRLLRPVDRRVKDGATIAPTRAGPS